MRIAITIPPSMVGAGSFAMHRAFFMEAKTKAAAGNSHAGAVPGRAHRHGPQHSFVYHAILLVVTLLPVVLLAEPLTNVIDYLPICAGGRAPE